MTGATSGAEIVYPSGAPEFTPVFNFVVLLRHVLFLYVLLICYNKD